MNRRFWIVFLSVAIILPVAVIGCKGKVQKTQEATMPPAVTEGTEQGQTAPMTENVVSTEPAQTVATETIPPTATPGIAAQPAQATAQQAAREGSRGKDIQRALKNAGFYAGSIDGKIGSRTKKAIADFQKAKGLKADGKVGPKTWAELEKYLTQ